jgi:hypothetical protein
MSSPVHTWANSRSNSLLAQSPPAYSPLSTVQTSASIPLSALDMKDLSTANRHSRTSLIYPKKRPSPNGIAKSHKTPLLPAHGPVRRTPRSAKSGLVHQRQREAHILALRREGILLEEEYREEIRYYMHDMEVSWLLNAHFVSRALSKLGNPHCSCLRCVQLNLWISNLKYGGICDLV